jgi:hypothetical protein
MKAKSVISVMLSPAPIIAIALIGLMFLSALVYYRAVEIQRYLEPALAISQPRNEVAEAFQKLLVREFGGDSVEGIRFSMGSVYIYESLLFDDDRRIRPSANEILQKLDRVFRYAFTERPTDAYIDMVLVSLRYPLDPGIDRNKRARERAQRRTEQILEAMYRLDPQLQEDYGRYFAAAALPAASTDRKTGLVEFRIVPGEMLHIEMLTRLHKYVQ